MLKSILSKSIAAGVLISIGAIVKLHCNSPIVGAILFSIGLFFICAFECNLFTGKIAYINKTNWKEYILIWIGNFQGCIISAVLIHLAQTNTQDIAHAVLVAKLDQPIYKIAILGFFCGIIMFLAVDNYKNSKSEISKVFGIVIGVTVFLVAGFEHSIADMAYACIGAKTWFEVLKSFIVIIAATFGNAMGSIVAKIYLTKRETNE